MIKTQGYQIKGMNQDALVATGRSATFAHEIMNLRLNTVGDYTTASWTTEEGTLHKSIHWDESTDSNALKLWYNNPDRIIPIGQAVLNGQWIVFATQELEGNTPRTGIDFIFKFWYKYNTDDLYGIILYAGDLNFDAQHPCETITYYENDQIQKIYWIDGKNQPRVINIVNVKAHTNLPLQFDFIQEVDLKEKVTITPITTGGLFPPGTVKYCLTYYYKYGQETNIVYDSPLFYTILGDRGCSPEELSSNSFEIKIENLDNSHKFDCIRLYSIVRTSEDATAIVRIVGDKDIDSSTTSVTFVDTNLNGEIVDPTILQYVGGTNVIPQTFGTKSNSLFLGNLELVTKSASIFKDKLQKQSLKFTDYSSQDGTKKLVRTGNVSSNNTNYNYYNQLQGSSQEVKTFKYGEHYRVGIQFQDKYGVWSEAIYLNTITNQIAPSLATDTDGNPCYSVGFLEYKITDIPLVNSLIDAGFRKARLMICPNKVAERSRVCQGIVNKTIKNPKGDNYWSSYLFRLKAFDIINGILDFPYKNSLTLDSSIVTFNSPDIELDDTLLTLSFRENEIKKVGILNFRKIFGGAYVDANPSYDASSSRGEGLPSTTYTANTLINNFKWKDADVYWPLRDSPSSIVYPLYIWQRQFLNNYSKDLDFLSFTYSASGLFGSKDYNFAYDRTVRQTGSYNSKCLSFLEYFDTSYSTTLSSNLAENIDIYNSTEYIPTLIDNTIYYGNVDSILEKTTVTTKSYFVGDADKDKNGTDMEKYGYTAGYQILIRSGSNLSSEFPKLTTSGDHGYFGITKSAYDNRKNKGKVKPLNFRTFDPIHVTYKSTPHLVVKTTTTLNNEYILADVIKNFNLQETLLDTYIPSTGTYKDKERCSTFLQRNSPLVIHGMEGDCYLMRYDCLKTYFNSTKDINQLVNIGSFFVETYQNLDGRYDKRRGWIDNTTVSPTNFNLINKSYNQSNNYFSYTQLDPLSVKLDEFSNQFTWTKEKTNGELVDTWTNITLASTADAQGNCGAISKIINVNDNLYLFQEHGLARIGFNEKTALSTESGVPLEIANSGKYSGLVYLSTDIGCQNKWSISSTKNGLFFIDDTRAELLVVGERLESLSTQHGFDAFLLQELPDSEHFKHWTPYNPQNFVSYYDKISNDVYFINKKWCLAWNEQSKTFTSFYSYNDVPLIANVGTHTLMWDIHTPLTFVPDIQNKVVLNTKKGFTNNKEIVVTSFGVKSNNSCIWAARENNYNCCKFFDSVQPYWITIVCDGITSEGNAFAVDKVFNNIEYRADIFDRLTGQPRADITQEVFDAKAAYNGYQMYELFPQQGIRKFGTWRVQLPRATYEINNTITTTRDRIRNPYCYIKLMNTNGIKEYNMGTNYLPNRMILHDLIVYYDMR